jgi:phage host-nuclease inhibitor protein Gam
LKKVNAEFDRLARVYNDEVAAINEKYKNVADLSAINREVLIISNQQSSLNNEISKIKAEAET